MSQHKDHTCVSSIILEIISCHNSKSKQSIISSSHLLLHPAFFVSKCHHLLTLSITRRSRGALKALFLILRYLTRLFLLLHEIIKLVGNDHEDDAGIHNTPKVPMTCPKK